MCFPLTLVGGCFKAKTKYEKNRKEIQTRHNIYYISAYREACANIELMRRQPHPPSGGGCGDYRCPTLTDQRNALESTHPQTEKTSTLWNFFRFLFISHQFGSVEVTRCLLRVTASRALAKYVSICSSISCSFPFPVLCPFPFLMRYSYTIAYPVLNVGAVSRIDADLSLAVSA